MMRFVWCPPSGSSVQSSPSVSLRDPVFQTRLIFIKVTLICRSKGLLSTVEQLGPDHRWPNRIFHFQYCFEKLALNLICFTE